MRGSCAAILRDLEEVKKAVTALNRAFTGVQVSNLLAIRMDVIELTDFVGAFRKLANVEQPGLFDDSTGLETVLASFRQKFEHNPLLRYADLFTLRFTATGDDGKPNHYHDFKQGVESHGTTITIKVLFNLARAPQPVARSKIPARRCSAKCRFSWMRFIRWTRSTVRQS